MAHAVSQSVIVGEDGPQPVVRTVERGEVEAPILLFRTELLHVSETFIQAQAHAMRRFQPIMIGWHRVNGLDLRQSPHWVPNTGGATGRLRELRFRVLNRSTALQRNLGGRRPLLIHAHFGTDACAALPLAANFGIPLITTFHGFDVTVSDTQMAEWRIGREFLRKRSRLQKRGVLFVAVSRFIASRLLSAGFPEERIVVHHIGIDTSAFSPVGDVRTPSVLFVARLVEKKGCAYLIHAMADVQSVFPDVELVIIGDGPQRQSLEEQAKSSLRRYRFLGAQTSDTVKAWMKQATLFCVPSITAANGDTEGFGMVFIEAQASGLPVVSFSTGGIPEAVADNETGMLCQEGDWRGLATKIITLLRNRELWQQFSKQGMARVRRDFDLFVQTAQLEAYYDRIVRSHTDFQRGSYPDAN